MNTSDVMKLLEENKNDRGIKNWEEMEEHKCNLKSYGMGLTVHRKLAKQIGKDHELALKLWDSDYYDAKVISILIDDPKQITPQQLEEQTQDIDFGMMVHVISACGAPAAKTDFVQDLAEQWIHGKDSVRQRCGFGFIYELSKSKKKSAPSDEEFMNYVNFIDENYEKVDKSVHLSMGTALMGIGKRSKALNQAALKVADRIGKIPVESGKTQCDPMDISKHLTSDYVVNKWK